MIIKGELVLYFKDGIVNTNGSVNKYLFMVDNVKNNKVTLDNITQYNSKPFETSVKDVISVLDYEDKYGEIKDIVSDVTYTRYKNLKEDIRTKQGRTYRQIIAERTIDMNLSKEYTKEELKGYKKKSKEISMKDKVKQTVDSNVSAAKVAASITAGKALNKVVADKVTPQLPMMVQGYANTALGRVVLANAFDFGVKQFMPTNEKANLATKAMMEAAMVEMLEQFDFEKMVNEVVNSVELPVVE